MERKAKRAKRKVGSKKLKAESEKRKAENTKLKAASEEQDERKVKDVQATPTVAADPSDHSFDFGGLPERSLKKNLGCG